MTDTLRELWDQIEAGPPPVADVTRDGDRVRRRRRLATVAGVAAVAAAVVVGSVAVQQIDGNGDRSVDSSAIPAPPDGMRWVGLGRVVVAVPDWWTTGETPCLLPAEDTVYFETGATTRCGATPPDVRKVSALAVLDATKGLAEEEVASMLPIAEVEGRQVVEREGCEEWLHVCRHLFAVPEEGVMFAVTIDEPGDADYDAIRDSLRILPAALTTVPLAGNYGNTPGWGAEPGATRRLVKAIEDAGLRAEVVEATVRDDLDFAMYADFRRGSYLGASPELGSPIELGGTVTVTVAGPQVTAE